MRTFLLLTVLWLGTAAYASADEQLIERFDGHNSLTTSDFKVPDGWELRWHSNQMLSVGVILLDNTVVAGATGMNNGSLYIPKGGTFRIKVKGEDPIPWDVAVVVMGPAPTAEDTNSDDAPFYVPTPGPAEPAGTEAAPAEEGASTNGPAASLLDTNSPPASPPTPPPPPVPTTLTDQQSKAIVQVKGDRAQGAGFLIKTPTGPMVITNLHLLSDNPRLEITTPTGSEVQMLSLQAAPDRDLAMIGIQDNAYTYLDQATDITGSVQAGDPVLTSKKNSGGDPPATVLTVRPDRIDLDHFHDHGETGGPVFEAKTGKVIGVVTAIPQVALATDLDKTPYATRDATAANTLVYVALRFDAVNWETYDWKRYNNETAFLDQFNRESRCLDSYLNNQAGDDRPTAKLYMTDEKIKSANDGFVQDSAGGDSSQRMDALRALLFELGTVASTDMDQIEQPVNFYSYNQIRARDEMSYRNALKGQLDYYGNNLNRFSSVARRDN